MKYFISFIFCFISIFKLFADCGSSGFHVLPSKKTIKQNSIFILEGYYHSQYIITKLNIDYPVYLKSGNKKIKLKVKEINVGQMDLTQAVLYPDEILEAGKEYTLYVGNLPINNALYQQDPVTGPKEISKYLVEEGMDTITPKLNSIPKFVKNRYSPMGCGPAEYSIFDFPAKDNSDIYVKASVKNLKMGTVTSYYLPIKDSQILIGHGMCSGAFTFRNNDQMEVQFSMMDACGNVVEGNGKSISFTKPTEKDMN